MIATLQCVVVDCPDPRALGALYHEILGGELADGEPPRVELTTPTGLRIAFQRAENHQPPRWPDPERPAAS
ncbi:VOC family protein [Streptomyces profundus]|uniref:VOC family protein n=1 Tax=Streptomyces profundus TaxID=2867410 RepID=UPI001D169788|nr:VOC family protein [Streptomyces sp. MA3_2.13]UED83609.1 hypothetical protein K4G22_04795 [Streptomyces sp. MA3_2.13]